MRCVKGVNGQKGKWGSNWGSDGEEGRWGWKICFKGCPINKLSKG